MADESVQPEYEFFDYALFQVELLILTDGWSADSFKTPKGLNPPWDLERAIEHIALSHHVLAAEFDYPELGDAKTMMAEMKAYLASFMPETRLAAKARLSGFNDSTKTVAPDVLEVLELAREAYRRPHEAFRDQHTLLESNQHIWMTVGSDVGVG